MYARFGDLPYAKPVDSVSAYLLQMVAGGLVLNVLLALVFGLILLGSGLAELWF